MTVPGGAAALDPAVEAAVREGFAAQAPMTTLGVTLEHVSAGEVAVAPAFDPAFDPALGQQHGFLHAGSSTTLLDTPAGSAALTTAPAGSEVVSVSLAVSLLAPARGAAFTARAHVRERSSRERSTRERR